MLAMRRMVLETVSQLIDDNEDFSLCQTNDPRWLMLGDMPIMDICLLTIARRLCSR